MPVLLRTLLSRELIALGLRELHAHKLRSFLTALGMIFGVGAVICMLSIGEGAEAKQLESIRLLGSRNIIVRSIEPPQTNQAGESNARVANYGIRRSDVERIGELPCVKGIVRMREIARRITCSGRKFDGHVIGVTDNLFTVVNIALSRGRVFNQVDEQRHAKVCVVGFEVAEALFMGADPLGQVITVHNNATGAVPYSVIGVLGREVSAGAPAKGKGERNINREVFVPLQTVDLRYGDILATFKSGSREMKRVEYSDLYVNVDEEENVLFVSQNLKRLMEHGHKDQDYNINVPLELLQQVERNKRLWQAVLGSIAGISLLVGGIGIMNIMLASVTERTREIGIRRALGARRHHITAQFLIETLILSICGGLAGVVLGIGCANLVSMMLEDLDAIVTLWGVALSFGVSALVGIGFGLYPAQAAAKLDPIEALRYE